ncbi:MAG: DUF4097 family beta strand repeat-containing protein [Eubacterium sp.]|nr:DUF4097 family beta strand repeat-containing protein [Eubacterium sp.]
MKRSTKIILITAAVLVVFGGALAAVGAALGGLQNSFYIDRQGVHQSTAEPQKLEYTKLPDQFDTLTVALSATRVEILPGSENAIEGRYGSDGEALQITEENGAVNITASGEKKAVIDIGGIHSSAPVLRIYLDESSAGRKVKLSLDSGEVSVKNLAQVKALEIDTGMGDVKVTALSAKTLKLNLGAGNAEVAKAQLGELQLENHLGETKLTEVSADRAVVKNASGEISFGGGAFGYLEIDQSLGEVELERTTLKGGKITSASGDVSVDGELSGDIEIQSSLGDVEVTTANKVNQYSYTLETKLGEIEVEDKETGVTSAGQISWAAESPRGNIKIYNTSGDISLSSGHHD